LRRQTGANHRTIVRAGKFRPALHLGKDDRDKLKLMRYGLNSAGSSAEAMQAA